MLKVRGGLGIIGSSSGKLAFIRSATILWWNELIFAKSSTNTRKNRPSKDNGAIDVQIYERLESLPAVPQEKIRLRVLSSGDLFKR